MRLSISFSFLLFFLAACNSGEGPANQAAAVPSKHSAAFNQSIQSILDQYYRLTEAFVNWDSAAAPTLATALTAQMDSLPLGEIHQDSSARAASLVSQAKKDLSAIAASSDITTKRHALNSLSDNLFDFLAVVRYDREKLYLQECPMAFNDEESGLWISKKEEIRNPYLGLHHPRYGKGMLECGDNKEVLNNTGVQ